jgi:hypothetical protein
MLSVYTESISFTISLISPNGNIARIEAMPTVLSNQYEKENLPVIKNRDIFV